MKNLKAEKWRRKLVAMRNRGIPLEVCAEKINEEFGIKEKTIKQQWYDRKSWLTEVFDLDYEDTEQLINDLVAEKKTIKEVLWGVIQNGGSNAKIGAVRELNKIDESLVEMLQGLGLIYKEPEKLQIKEKIEEELENNPEKREKIKELHNLEKELEDN